MNRALHIIGIVLSIGFFVLIIYYIQRFVQELISSMSLNPLVASNYSGAKTTVEAGIVFGLLYAFFLITFIIGLIRIKRVTYKVIGIIAVIISGGMLVWDIVMLSSPSHITFTEVAPVYMLYSPIILAFSIVGLIQAIRANRPNEIVQTRLESELLDS